MVEEKDSFFDDSVVQSKLLDKLLSILKGK